MYICDSHTGRPHMHELSFFNLSTPLRVFIDSCHFTRSILIFPSIISSKIFLLTTKILSPATSLLF